MTALAWTIPGEPVGKGRPRFVRATGRTYTPSATRAWEITAVAIMRQPSPLDGPLRVEVTAIKRRPKRLERKADPEGLLWRTTKPDADNVAKAVLDAATKANIWHDDAQVAELCVRSLYAAKGGAGRVEVRVATIDSAP